MIEEQNDSNDSAPNFYSADLPAHVTAEVNARNPGGTNLTAEQTAYLTKLAAPAVQHRAAKAARPDGFSRAVENFKAEVEAQNLTNIHQVNAKEIRLDVAAAEQQLQESPPTEFDDTAFESELGLASGAIQKLGINDSETALEASRGIAHATAQLATSDDVDEQLREWTDNEDMQPALEQLHRRVIESIDSFKSERYGTSASRTADQQAECHKLWDHAMRQSMGAQKSKLKTADIGVYLKRARLVLDPDYNPVTHRQSSRSSSRAAQSEPVGYANIHTAYQQNPF